MKAENNEKKALLKKQWLFIAIEALIGGCLFFTIFEQKSHILALGVLIVGLLSYRLRKISSQNRIKYWYSSVKKFFNKLGWLPLFGIIAYSSWCYGLMVYVKKWSTGIASIDYLIRPIEAPEEFLVSYAASSLDSLIFFLLVGILLAINSMRQPEDEKLSRKIEHIFPTVPTESKLLRYLIDNISKLACINKLTERVITISEYSQSDNFIKLSIKSHSVIKNMHNNYGFSAPDMPWSFAIDKCKPNEEILGEVHEISIVRKIGDSSEEKHILDGIATLTESNKEHSECHSLKLKPEQEILYQTNSWAWECINKEWKFNSSRYTEKRCFTIINKTKHNFTIEVNLTKPSSNSIDGLSSQTNKKTHSISAHSQKKEENHPVKIEHEKLLPDEGITLKFLLQETTNSGDVVSKKENTKGNALAE